jgi:hypothetical protein
MAGQTLAIHDVAPVIHPHCVQHALGDSDPEDVPLVLQGTRLLWLNGFTALERIVAHCRRAAQGRVHFITTGFLCLYYVMIRVADQHLWTTFDRASPATSDPLPGAGHPDTAWPALSPPGSRARSVHACWGSQTAQSPSSTRGGVLLDVAFHSPTSVGALDAQLSRRNTSPTCTPTDFSSVPSRRPPHGSGPEWCAGPSPEWTCTICSLPVPRQIWAKCHTARPMALPSRHPHSTCARAASVSGSQKVISMARQSAIAIESSVQACSRRPSLA